jgi:general secretion pathway protein M
MADNNLMQFWRARSTRERWILGIGGAILALALLHGLVYAPVMAARAKLEKRLPQTRAEVRQMRAQVVAVEHHMATSKSTQGASGLQGRIGQSATEAGLREAFSEITALPDGRVRVVGGAVPTQAGLRWLADLEKSGTRIIQCALTPTQVAGVMAMELQVQGSGQ